ncbi:hypothetical protein CEXT_677571 [Caerostris extrusa]|uniref:Uncharacterized protein n=1 Tax=Caerostris extrusa TaxID=172846 RepID=A0AAV4NJ76_CAEEX|nr:hypothetical protein CEXT_677571 [Caerostris extrusa]
MSRHARKLPTSSPEPTVPPAVISRSMGQTAQNDTPFPERRKRTKKLKKIKRVLGKGGPKWEKYRRLWRRVTFHLGCIIQLR